jgi:hypothetical protein
MIALLAIIGLVVVLYFLSRILTSLGNFINNLGDVIAVKSTVGKEVGTAGPVKVTAKMKEKLHVIHGEGTEEEYWDRVNREIKEMESGMNEGGQDEPRI